MNELENNMTNPYFELQAEMGFTKHGGGAKSTEELITLCHIDKTKYVLDVGCSVGRTVCTLVKKCGCKVVGVDIYEKMIEQARQRANKRGLNKFAEFLVGDVQKLPFENDLFDAVISESVIAFVDKQTALDEFVRVTRPGGYIGLNESTWVKTPPPEQLVEFLHKSIGFIIPETAEGWKKLLEESGLQDIIAIAYKITPLTQFMNEIKQFNILDASKAWYKLMRLYFSSSYYNKVIKEMIRDARNRPKNMMEYFGYGIYVGKKISTL